MMRTIWKFPVPVADSFTLELPIGATFLSMQVQNQKVQVWFLVDPDAEKRRRHFAIFGTGHPIPPTPLIYLGTFQVHGGDLVFHLFEVGSLELVTVNRGFVCLSEELG